MTDTTTTTAPPEAPPAAPARAEVVTRALVQDVALPGGGGTVQEVFQDACENSYAEEGAWAPLVLLGERFWTETMPAWPLLQAVMRDRPGAAGIAVVDTPADAVARISAFDPAEGAQR